MPEPKYKVELCPGIDKDLDKLDKPERKAILDWIEFTLPFTPFRNACQMKYVKPTTFRAKIKKRLRIIFRFHDDELWVYVVDRRDGDTYDQTTLRTRQTRVESKRSGL
ncbi:MAG: hypothetical protein IPO31_06745 [Candidatus Obscuribacter sp.]|nr:hypothetical protein [Candidatus Obscuribacter sp.]